MARTQKIKQVAVFGASFSVAVLLTSISMAQDAWRPQRPVEVVVGSAPGGGNDKTGRTIQKIWSDTKQIDSVVVNRVGGGGAIAYTYVSQKNDPHFIGVAQASLLTNNILGNSPLKLSDVTPLAMIGSEPAAIAVRADSRFKTMKDLLDQLKANPGSLSISVGSTRGSTNHIAIALAAKSQGVDPRKLKILVFGGSAESITNLLGGHIDAMSGLINNVVPHMAAGTVRVLCVTSEKRSPSLPDAPTCKEQGVDVITENWTVLIGPKSLKAEQISSWEGFIQRMVGNSQWKTFLDTNAWSPAYKDAAETRKFLETEQEETRAVLDDIGMVKK